MKRLETMLYNAITTLLEESFTDYEGFDDELFVEMVCESIGLTETEYKKLITGDTSECEWNLED